MMNTTGTDSFTWPTATQSYSRKQGAAEAPAASRGASAAGYADSVADPSRSTLETDSADATEDRFLKLLVAQMRNQDPLNPLDNAQVTTQLAQISTVRGIEGLNKTMGSFVASQGTAAASVGMLGRQVLVPGETFSYQPPAAGGATRLGFELAAPASALRLEVIDAAGKVVHTRTMTDVAAGMQTFEWDGRTDGGSTVSAGPLAVRIGAFDGNVPVEAVPLVPARVVGITQSAGAAQLELDGAAPVAPSEVRLIL
jgi:flagellar basal-body rod modification protein FlgD